MNLPMEKKKNGRFIRTIGYLATALVAVATTGVIAALALSTPEIRRYIKIASM
jgi:hypothetical protein